MRKMNNLLINGLVEPLAIDVNQQIEIDWSHCELPQIGYELKILHNNHTLYQVTKIKNHKKRIIIILPFENSINDRESFIVELAIENSDGVIEFLTKDFYSSNSKLKEAKWITRLDNPIQKEYEYFEEESNIVFTRKIDIDTQIKNAFIDIVGLGYYVLKINGKRIHDSYLVNDVTNYDKKVYYDTYDIKKYLNIGSNEITVELGNGWYNPAPIHILGKYNIRKQLAIGKTCLLAQVNLNYENGKKEIINTNSDWQVSYGNLLRNDIYIGEYYTDQEDKRIGQTVSFRGPNGILESSHIQKIKRVEKLIPILIKKETNKLIYDVKELISGQIKIKIDKTFVGEIVIKYAEKISKDQELDVTTSISGVYGLPDKEFAISSNDLIVQVDRIRKTQQKQLNFDNEFTYHSFRYLEIEFLSDEVVSKDTIISLEVFKTHTDLSLNATFETSDLTLNNLWEAGINTKLNNIHSYFEDCSRERFGYGGDIVALLESQKVSFEAKNLLQKVFKDFASEQTSEGGITQTAPYVGIMTHGPSNKAGSVGWQLVFPKIASSLLDDYDDKQFVLKYLVELEKHVDYLLSFDYEYIRYCCLGDWGSSDTHLNNGKIETPDQLFCTSVFYLICLQTYLQLFEKIGNEDGRVKQLTFLISEIKGKLIKEFYHDGYFAEGSQSSYIFALYAAILEDSAEVLENFVQLLDQNEWKLTVGIFGMSWIYELLPKFNLNNQIYKWLTRSGSQSYQAMLTTGNRVLSEYFPVTTSNPVQDKSSINHAMFSSYGAWLIHHLLGIMLNEERKEVLLQPFLTNNLTHVSGSIHSSYGTISSKWEQNETGSYTVNLKVPVGLELSIKEQDNFDITFKQNEMNQGYQQCVISFSYKREREITF